jgi:hypothetical protein
MLSSELRGYVGFVGIDVSEARFACTFRVERINELEAKLAVCKLLLTLFLARRFVLP